MKRKIVVSNSGITLIGGGPVPAEDLAEALARAPRLVAADGGADRALELGALPEAVIGDLDSLGPAARQRLTDRLHPVAEQITTDFDKALRHVDAPFILGVGFTGGRLDHALAALSTLAAHPDQRCILLSERDLVLLAPPALKLKLPIGTRLSLYPLAPVRGSESGLLWPIAGLEFRPDGRLGTSNEVSAQEVRLSFDAPHMLLILPRDALSAVLEGLLAAPVFRGE